MKEGPASSFLQRKGSRMGLQLSLLVLVFCGVGIRSAPGHPLSSGEGEEIVFGVLKTATGSCMAAYGILYVWYLLCIGKLNEVIFKTGLRKMQVDLFFFILNCLYGTDMTWDRDVMNRRR